MHFEHCYRIDEERLLPIADKLQCWREWTHRYQYGQSRDRIGYALGRERSLAQAIAAGQQAAPHGGAGALPATPAMAAGKVSTTASGSAEPAPGSAIGSGGAPVIAAETRANIGEAPGASCGGACAKTWSACAQQCKPGSCRSECDEHYRGCMRACF